MRVRWWALPLMALILPGGFSVTMAFLGRSVRAEDALFLWLGGIAMGLVSVLVSIMEKKPTAT